MPVLNLPVRFNGRLYVPADPERPTLQVANFRSRETEDFYKFHSPKYGDFARIAAARDAHMMPFVQFSEQQILNGMFGNMCAAVKTAITAAATAQTSIALMNASTYINAGRSGGNTSNCDQTPNTTAFISVYTPGTTPNYNTAYTAPHTFLLTNSSATAGTIASQSIGLAISVGDFVFTGGSASAGGDTTGMGPMYKINAFYIGLSTAAGSASQATLLAGEPTSTGSYQRIGYTGSTTGGVASVYGIPNTQANFPLATAASPSVMTSGAAFAFAQSSAGWSTGATNLTAMFFADALTLDGGDLIAAGALTTPQAVNAASITLSFASTAITVSLT